MKSYVPYLSLRYLLFHKVSSGLGILGVTLGVGMVIVVVGVMDGFQTRLKKVLIGNTAAVVVQPHYDVDAEALVKALESVPGVVAASPVVSTMTLITPEGGNEGEGRPCQVVGIDPAREDRVSDLGLKLRRGYNPTHNSATSLLESASLEQPFRTPDADRAREKRIRSAKQGVILGSSLKTELGVPLGGQVQLFTLKKRKDGEQRENGGDLTYEVEVFRVTGVFRSGDYEVDKNLVLMDRRDALSFFREGMAQEVKEVRLLLEDSERCEEIKKAIRNEAKAIVAASLRKGGRVQPDPLGVATWRDIHHTIVRAVENERGLLVVIASFSFIVVAFLIGSTQSMLVVEKTREIGVLRSLGASVAGTSAVFLGNGFFIGSVGALAGCGLGISITSNIQAIADWINRVFGIPLFPEDIYRFDHIPIDVKGDFLLFICCGAVLFALLGSILPAVRAAMLDPVESLHHE